jgi:NADPH-dependent curcumin reductase CurA
MVHTGPADTVIVSGAAGAVGSVAVQIAKHILGSKKVIGIAGTDAKCRWVESLGADVCLNYKAATFSDDLITATEGYAQVFFDNIGGEILDRVITRVRRDGRIAACGAMADYNDSTPIGIKNWYDVIAMRMTIRGFVVTDATPARTGEIVNALVRGYTEGKIKANLDGQTIVPANFEDIPETWMRLFTGQSTGKLLTKLL